MSLSYLDDPYALSHFSHYVSLIVIQMGVSGGYYLQVEILFAARVSNCQMVVQGRWKDLEEGRFSEKVRATIATNG